MRRSNGSHFRGLSDRRRLFVVRFVSLAFLLALVLALMGMAPEAASKPETASTVTAGGAPVPAQTDLTSVPGAAGNSPITFTPATLPGGIVDTYYGSGIYLTGGVPPYSVTLAGLFPPGIHHYITNVGLSLFGTPTYADTYTFYFGVTDSTGAPVVEEYPITIRDKVIPGTPTLQLNGKNPGDGPLTSILIGSSQLNPVISNMFLTGCPPNMPFNIVISSPSCPDGTFTPIIGVTNAQGNFSSLYGFWSDQPQLPIDVSVFNTSGGSQGQVSPASTPIFQGQWLGRADSQPKYFNFLPTILSSVN